MRARSFLIALAVTASLAATFPAHAVPDDPQPGTPEWQARDAQNMADATGRIQDELSNPAFARQYWTEALPLYLSAFADQLQNPTHPVVSASRILPGQAADPYRRHWDGARGVMSPIEYTNRYGARIIGHIWAPKIGAPDAVTAEPMEPPFPAVVITTGSIQGYEELYWWAAQGLAEAGYVVMTYDVQGQGSSEVFGHNSDGTLNCTATGCPGVPFQNADNFFSGTADALKFFLSDDNPMRGEIDLRRLGLAGHSLGATAVTQMGNAPTIDTIPGPNPIKAVVAWDYASLASGETPRVPTLSENADYFFNPQPQTAQPAEGKRAWFNAFEGNEPAMQISLRSSTHLEFTFVPYILPASHTGERVAMYYTLAWFDRWLKGPADAAQASDARRRLLATHFDGSADRSAIGAGAYDLSSDANVPTTIAGGTVADHVSFYYKSSYSFDGFTCEDMRTGCA